MSYLLSYFQDLKENMLANHVSLCKSGYFFISVIYSFIEHINLYENERYLLYLFETSWGGRKSFCCSRNYTKVRFAMLCPSYSKLLRSITLNKSLLAYTHQTSAQ